MITRHETHPDKQDIWSKLAAPIPPAIVQWRQQGKPKPRDGKFYAPFVAYIDAQFVRERLDLVVPGEWDLTFELLPVAVTSDGEEVEPFSFKARLQILGVIREDVGSGKDYKTASTDAFKRAAVRFGVGHELYTDYEIVWVQVDSDSKYAKPVEDPNAVYARKSGAKGSGNATQPQRAESARAERNQSTGSVAPNPAPPILEAARRELDLEDEPSCPKCDGPLYDNRAENDARAARGEKLRPDWKCKDKGCAGVIWRPKAAATKRSAGPLVSDDEYPPALEDGPDNLPF